MNVAGTMLGTQPSPKSSVIGTYSGHADGRAGRLLIGVPKAMSALLSGEMRDTVEINQAAVYLLERFFSRSERAKLFRTWAGSASMMLKGGNDVWGTSDGAPDDFNNSTLTGGNL